MIEGVTLEDGGCLKSLNCEQLASLLKFRLTIEALTLQDGECLKSLHCEQSALFL